MCVRGAMANVTLGITGLLKFWIGIKGLKNPIGFGLNAELETLPCI